MDLTSIREDVAINKQRFIKFPFTSEVVEFLLASIDTLTKENKALNTEKVGMIASLCALTKENESLMTDYNLACEDAMECAHKESMVKQENTALTERVEMLREEEVSWVSCGVQNAAKVLKVDAENAALTEKVEKLDSAIDWALGYDTPHEVMFDPPVDDKPRYWWRAYLAKLRDQALTEKE